MPMSMLTKLRASADSLLRSLRGRGPAPAPPRRPPVTGSPRPGRVGAGAPVTDTEFAPGRIGPDATVEVDPRRIGRVHMTYSPATDGDPDPGEIVWTWVPFEERDGRGKDRPVLVVAGEPDGTWLAVQLTSKPHQGDAEFVPVGAGAWDSAGRPSWVNVDRVFRLHRSGMRREACALPAAPFGAVQARLRQRYGWH
jgi:hypothetical protein